MVNQFRLEVQKLNKDYSFVEEMKYHFRKLKPIEPSKLRFYDIDNEVIPDINFEYTQQENEIVHSLVKELTQHESRN